MDHLRCRNCHEDVVPLRPKATAKLINFAFWIAALVTATAFSLLLGLNVVLVPMWFGIGMAVGTSAERLAAWSCPSCKAEMIVPDDVAHELRGRKQPKHRPLVPAHV